jgi:hypothetical protein
MISQMNPQKTQNPFILHVHATPSSPRRNRDTTQRWLYTGRIVLENGIGSTQFSRFVEESAKFVKLRIAALCV